MACIIHKWNGCKCEKCGKTRDKEHDFRAAETGCAVICSRCGATKEGYHYYSNGYCSRCGIRSKWPIDTGELTPEEIRELKPVLVGLMQASGRNDGWEMGSRLSQTYNQYHAYDHCAKDYHGFDGAVPGAAGNLDTGRLTLKQAVITAICARESSKMLSELIRNQEGRNHPGNSLYSTLAEMEKVTFQQTAGSFSGSFGLQRELDTGMELDSYRHFVAIKNTINLLDSAAGKIERSIIGYREALAEHGDSDEDEDFTILY